MHRLHGVGGQVDQGLQDLGDIGQRRRQIGLVVELQRHARGQGRAQQVHGLLEDRHQRGHFAPDRLAAAKGEDLLHHIAPAHGCLADLLQTLQRRGIGAHVLAHQFDIAQDGGEDVVEIVRNASGQRADGLHLVRFAQLRFEQSLRGLTGGVPQVKVKAARVKQAAETSVNSRDEARGGRQQDDNLEHCDDGETRVVARQRREYAQVSGHDDGNQQDDAEVVEVIAVRPQL